MKFSEATNIFVLLCLATPASAAAPFSLLRKTRKLQDTCTAGEAVSTAYDQNCMQEVPGAQKYGCTANDVRIASVTVKQLKTMDGTIIPPDENNVYSCQEGETLSVSFEAELLNGAKSTRNDVAVWWRKGGETAITSPDMDCAVTRFTNAGLVDLEDIAAGEGDECGDMQGQTTLFADVCDLLVLCDDPSGQEVEATVNVASCTTYKIPGANEICDTSVPEGLATLLPGSPSKCKCEFTDFGIIIERCTLEASCLLPNEEDQCEADVPPPTTVISDVFDITSTDPCGGQVMSSNDVSNGGSGCLADPLIITRTYTLTDDVARTEDVSCPQTFTVIDDSAPVLSGVPDDTTVECDDVPDAPTDVTATDNCAEVTIAFDETIVPGVDGCGGAYTILRTWTATDVCGNSVSQTQTIAVVDTTAPTLSGVPLDATVECDSVPPPVIVTATDNCESDPLVILNEVETPGPSGCAGDYVITRTWTATDCSGNTASLTQTITVQDTTAPTLSGIPGDVTVECDSVPPPAMPTATDNCDADPVVTLNEVSTPGACAGEYAIARTWTATDCSGNFASLTQIVTVVDTTDPIITGISTDPLLVECDAVPEPPTGVASDNCGPVPTLIFSETRADGSCDYNYVLTRTWVAEDQCGRTTTLSQTVTVQDTTPPVIEECPAHDAIDICITPVPAAPTLTAVDNCGPPQEVTASCCFDGSGVTRTYEIEDSCGNAAVDCVQMITFNPICAV